MENNFKNKYGEWAIITGASSGIGKALAYEIANKGLNLVLIARGQTALGRIAEDIQSKFKVTTKVLVADLTSQTGINEVLLKTQQLQIGILVLSAGMENNGSFIKNNLETELQLIELNVVSTLKLTHHFTKEMEKRKKGGVLFISSLTAFMPSPYFSNYAATKSYIFSLATSLYGELKSKGIDISVLSPGVTNTPMSESTGIDWAKTSVKTMSPEDVAKETIQNFGKKLSIIPGKGNKIMAFMAKKVLSYDTLAMSNQKMMEKVLNPTKL